jgi:Rrf2 family protein
MYISAQADYALCALLTLAAADSNAPIKADDLAKSQGLPVPFLENILGRLRRAGFISSLRGYEGGYRLARPAKCITVADVIRALDGPIAEVRGQRPEDLVYEAPAEHLQDVWVATRACLRSVLERVTLANIVDGKLPASIRKLTADPEAWVAHSP